MAVSEPGAAPHLSWELGQEGDVHLLALGGQTFKQGLAGALGVIHGWLVALQEQEGPEQRRGTESCPRRRNPKAHGYGGAGGARSRPHETLTNILRCRAQTKPSPPLFPGPHTTSTVGRLVVKEPGG